MTGKGSLPMLRQSGKAARNKKKEPTEEEKQKLKEMEDKYKKWNKGCGINESSCNV